MKVNVGPMDKTVRLVLGAGLLIAGFGFTWWLALPGVVLIGTALVGRCPAYWPLGMSLCAAPPRASEQEGSRHG